MGTDIHVHLEYRSRKSHQYQYGGELSGAKCYDIFNTMAGEEVRGGGDPLFPLRGLPSDVTQATYEDFIDWGPDAHHPSWLTTNEFAACIVEAYIRLYRLEELRFRKEYEDMSMKLKLLSGIKQNDCLLSYKKILELMLSYEKDGEPCRIVFWFDN